MTKRAPDWWLTGWNEYGHSLDTGRIVQVTAGILAPESDPTVAISVAGETPVSLSYDAVARFQESLDWAVEEHRALVARAGEGSDTGDADTAVLDRARWRSVVDALRGEDARAREEAVKDLEACAPCAWVTAEGARTTQADSEAPRDLDDAP